MRNIEGPDKTDQVVQRNATRAPSNEQTNENKDIMS